MISEPIQMGLFADWSATSTGAVVLAAGLPFVMGCERRAPVPDEVKEGAKVVQSREAAAVALASGLRAPLGSVPSLVETRFEQRPPPGGEAPTPSDSCALDQVDGASAKEVTWVDGDAMTRFVGWAGDGATATVPQVVALVLSRAGSPSLYAVGVRQTKRPDVAAALKVPAFAGSGYDVLASFDGVPKGEYAISVLQVTPKGTSLTCDTRKRVNVQ